MKPPLVLIALGAIALTYLPSCAPNSSVPPELTTTTATDETQTAVKAGGSSSTADFLKTLKAAYENTSQSGSINVLEPGQSETIIAGVKEGVVDVGALSRPLKPEEQDDTVTFREVAQDALLVATHPSVTGITNLSTDDLKGIYSGSITNWQQLGGPDAPIVVLDRPEDESAKRLLRKHYLGDDLPNTPDAIVLRKEGELIEALQSTPYSMGAFSLAYAISHNLPINRLSLNEVDPTIDNLKTGEYPMVRRIGIIWHKNPSAPTQAFVDYVLSPASYEAMEQAGFARQPAENPPEQ